MGTGSKLMLSALKIHIYATWSYSCAIYWAYHNEINFNWISNFFFSLPFWLVTGYLNLLHLKQPKNMYQQTISCIFLPLCLIISLFKFSIIGFRGHDKLLLPFGNLRYFQIIPRGCSVEYTTALLGLAVKIRVLKFKSFDSYP